MTKELSSRWTEQAALITAHFECPTWRGTFIITAAFSVHRELRKGPNQTVIIHGILHRSHFERSKLISELGRLFEKGQISRAYEMLRGEI